MAIDPIGKARVGTGAEFEIPDVDDGMYDAIITDVKDGQGTWEGKDYDRYTVIWDLGDEVELAQFVRIPAGLINDGILNEESHLYKLMDALGLITDPEDIDVDANEWIGMPARIVVENKKVQSGKNAGQIRPRITSVFAAEKKPAGKPKPANKKPQPVGAEF